MSGRARRLAQALPVYARLAWWGLAKPRLVERHPLRVLQAVVRSPQGILLSVRSDLRGWELPGGNPRPGESDQRALRREVREETGLEVSIERHVGDYVRTGFRPHLARVFLCRVEGGSLRASRETPLVRWFPADRLPKTLFPWYRDPVADAFMDRPDPVLREERQGLRAIAAGLAIDLRMRLSDDQSG